MPHDPRQLYASLLNHGFREFSGVPCSILNSLIVEAENSDDVQYLPASVEGEAVAVGAGAWLAGSPSVVLLQNSGLGNAINPLASLCLPYRIPVLVISSWRGEPGRPDAIHHAPMGNSTPALFELYGIPVSVLGEDADIESAVEKSRRHIEDTRTPAALLIPRGSFESKGTPEISSTTAPHANPVDREPASVERFGDGELPSRTEFLAAFLDRCGDPDSATISTTGYMSRELSAHLEDRFFPMQGSMGFAAAIALGVTRAQPGRAVYVLDGDGALWMRLGSLATVGAAAPARYVHIVVDNGTYASTGGQKTVSHHIDFPGVAAHCGYSNVATCSGLNGLEPALSWARDVQGNGPALLRIHVHGEESEGLERPKRTPPEIAEAFHNFLSGDTE
ncbi:phosphonopyruvate decarboxylase [Myxococcota bacterium]|nr:phosphonopyruvate decarboxylase [Myxococcota bacterium]